MAYRISATTDSDAELLAAIRDLAWRERKDVSAVIREAFDWKLGEGFPRTNTSTCPLCKQEKVSTFAGLSKTGRPTYSSDHLKTCPAK